MDSAGAIAGPLLALALIGHFGMRGVFAAAASPARCAYLVAWVGIREVHRRAAGRALSCRALSSDWSQPGTAVAVTARSDRLPESADRVLLRAGGGHTVFAGQFQRHVPRAARGQHRNSRFARAVAGAGVQHDVHACFPGRRENSATASRAPPLRPRDTASLPSSILCLRWRRRARDLADHGFLRFVLRAHQSRAQGAGGGKRGGDVRGRALGIYFFVTSITTLLASVITGALWKCMARRCRFIFRRGSRRSRRSRCWRIVQPRQTDSNASLDHAAATPPQV